MSWRCPYDRCGGTGFVYDEERNIATDCECRPQMLAAARAAKLRGRIPERYRHVDFGTPPVSDMPRSVVRVVERYVDELDARLAEGRGLWFEGPHGTGKTTLGMLVSKRALAAGKSVAVYSVPRLLAELRDTFDDDAEMSATQLIDRLTAVELLHLDDLGAERTSPWVLEQLYSLINARYEAERAILVTTNLDREQLIEQIGARSVSRLTEICDVIPLYGDDHRLTAGLPSVPPMAVGDSPWRAPAPAANLARPDWPTTGTGDPRESQAEPKAPSHAAQPPSYWDRREPWPPAGE
ncbi:MAG: ATP-binding protein [Solirubrobacteraceae bacterium]|nr:ATP-binding protein [Solirubrobacteraceae bacterium]